ncbi:FtsX-like permease family protein [Rhodocytophaga rosea]|uniref:FtsX-like permease family protein n=1 Tax=Rhodocytophaga rosea TaxID=2704465 RepID=A0A6C0GQT4_9BACT|nr:ABC transporter permease [Rhodocytophaga rosea]QHT70445.1 FtsX-like permease family protein [Rhodocytophaga rosea]
MLKNYLIIGIRNLFRNKGYAILNISGLAIGIAACLLIFTVVQFELSYDKFHSKYDRIYRVVVEDKFPDGDASHNPGVPTPLPVALRQDIPQLEKVAAIDAITGSQITVMGKDANAAFTGRKFMEELGIFFTEPDFFEIFDATWLSGNPKQSLSNPNTVVLSQRQAEKYFGEWKQAMGQYLKLDNNLVLTVSGIIADSPQNTDFPLQVLISYETFKNAPGYGYSTEWGSIHSNHQTYVLLPPTLSPENVEYTLKKLGEKYYVSRNQVKRYNLIQPLSGIHFDTRFGNFGDHLTSKSTLWTLSLVGVLVLIMACINFINLATAQAISRSKEVGIRKVLGGVRLQLMGQFLAETTLIVLMAVVLATLIATAALPYIQEISNVPSTIEMLQNPYVLIFLVVITLVVSFFSGMYPALILSGFEPIEALKSKITARNIGGVPLRRSLVVVQFAISQILIIGTLIAVSQMDFIRNIELGFNKDAVYMVPLNSDSLSQTKFRTFKNRLLENPAIRSVSLANDPPSSDNFWGRNFYFNNSSEELNFGTLMKYADADYFSTYGMEFVAGHGFQESDTAISYVVNETLLRKLGVTDMQSAIGKTIRLGGGGQWKPIVGVVKDFKASSVRDEIQPFVITPAKENYYRAGIKIHPQNLQKTVKQIQALWEETFPAFVYNGNFLDESIANFYEQENQMALTYKIFAGLAILISCLGLYGLASFMAVQKTKEIGIRKVLGASVGSIIFLLSKEFLMLITLAFVIAAPAAYYLMHDWLENFQYSIPLGIEAFAIAIALSLVIAWLTVGYRAAKAALANPVKSLRSE